VHALGGVAIELARPAGVEPVFSRPYRDLDLITTAEHRRAFAGVMEAVGYEPDEQFNALNGRRRLLFWDAARARQVDVFVDAFEMCHSIPLLEGEPGSLTVPLAELLLTKLQIVELNEKDAQDVVNLLATQPEGAIDADRVAALCAADWGLWRTVSLNLDRVAAYSQKLAGPRHVLESTSRLRERIDAAPKPRRWRARALIGDRVRWYDEPEEVR
jgi:hypothetical protein